LLKLGLHELMVTISLSLAFLMPSLEVIIPEQPGHLVVEDVTLHGRCVESPTQRLANRVPISGPNK